MDTGIASNGNGSYHLTGTGLNGLSEGAAFGDDNQMDSNYPLVRFTDGSGNVHYGRTYNWSSTGVMTGTNLVSTDFTLPPNLPAGSYLEVVANGIASDPVAFYPSDTPTVNFVYPTNNAVLSDSSAPQILGYADDTNATLKVVRVALSRNTDNAWYDFVSGGWDTTPFDFNRNVLNASYVSGNHTGWLAQMPSLPAGNYTVQAQSVNLFNASPWKSVGFTIESPPVVTFSPLTDLQTVFDFNQLGGTVNETSTVQFKIEWFKAGGNQFWNGANWTSVASDPGVLLAANLSGLNWTPAPGTLPPRLQLAQASYVIHVFATDTAGDTGSNAIVLTRSPLDTTPPIVSSDHIQNGDVITNHFLPAISGLAYDPESGVASVNVLLARNTASGFFYWTGANWTATPTNLPATYSAQNISWQLNVPPPSGANLPNATYFLDVSATNNEVPDMAGSLNLSFSVDYHPVYVFTYGSSTDGDPNNDNMRWDNPANWDVGSVPTADAWVIINNFSPDNTSLGNFPLYRLDISGGQLMTAGMVVQKLNLSSGTLYGSTLSSTIRLATNGVCNWSGGTLQCSLAVPTNGVLTMAGGNGADYNLYGTLTNAGTIALVSGNLELVGTGCNNGIGQLVNLPGGLVDFQADVSIDSACGTTPLANAGLVRKSGGTGTSAINCIFNNSGKLDVQTGTLSLNGGGSSQGSFVADAGATLTYGASYEVDGLLTGAGTNLLNSTMLTGSGVITNGLFVWRGGTLGTGSALTVATNGVLMLAGGNGADYNLYGILTNAGTVQLVSGNLQLVGGGCDNGIGQLVNLPGGLVDFQADISIDNACGSQTFYNAGFVRKSGGTGTSLINSLFNNSGKVDVLTGTLSLNGGGIGNGLFVAEPGAELAYSGASYEVDSALAGGGSYWFTGGTVTLNGNLSSSNGVLAGGTLTGNTVVSGKLNWTSGLFDHNSVLKVATNGVLGLAGASGVDYNFYGTLTNAGKIVLVSGNLQLVGSGCDNGIGRLVNLPGGLVDFQADVPIDSACGTTPLVNGGLVRKSGGTGSSAINCLFINSGTLDARTGTLSLNGGGSSQGSFIADAGATLTYGGDYEVDGQLTGAGTNLLNGTTLTGTGMITNGLFVWRSGALGTGSAFTVVPNGVLMLAGVNGGDYNLYGTLTNAGTIALVSGNLQLVGAGCNNGISQLVNLPGGLVDFQADVSMDSACGSQPFYNAGLVRKSGGTGTSAISAIFNNTGTVDLRSGTLGFNAAYTTSLAGQLRVSLGGQNPGMQYGSEAFSGAATFAGTLGISLTNGFVPANGNTFVLATYTSSTGQFATTQFPPLPLELGWKLTYAANSMLLQVVPANAFQTSSLTNGSFQFTFGGETGSSCLIEVSTNLLNWDPLITNTPFNGTLNYADPQTGQFQKRFYRATIFP
jgi:hypothetical protein